MNQVDRENKLKIDQAPSFAEKLELSRVRLMEILKRGRRYDNIYGVDPRHMAQESEKATVKGRPPIGSAQDD